MQYMLIYQEREDTVISEELTSKRIKEYYKWADKIGNTLISGHKLTGDFHIFHKDEQIDMPSSESKEIIAGVSIIEVDSEEKAIKIAQEHPFTSDFNVILRAIH